MAKRVLITGGAGFIGSHTAEALIEAGYEVTIVDNLYSGLKENTPSKASFFNIDIADREKLTKVLKEVEPETVLHLAATVEIGNSVKDPLSDARVNIVGTLNLYAAMKEIAERGILKKVLVASSQTTYGEGVYECKACRLVKKGLFRKAVDLTQNKFEYYCEKCGEAMSPSPIPEETIQFPANPYGISKLAEEKYLIQFAQLYNISGLALRYFNVYGPRQRSMGMEAAASATFFNRIINHNEPPIINEDGLQIRDFVYVKDIADVNVKAIQKGKGIEVYNVGHHPITIIKLAEEILGALKRKNFENAKSIQPKITNKARQVLPHAGTFDTRHTVADINKAKRELSWTPKCELTEGMNLTAEWALAHRTIL